MFGAVLVKPLPGLINYFSRPLYSPLCEFELCEDGGPGNRSQFPDKARI